MASSGLSDAEKAAVKERAAELKRQQTSADGAADIAAKIAEMPAAEQDLAQGLHDLVSAVAPQLVPRTWYGMPAYALPGQGSKPGPIVVFFQSAAKMKTRYCTIGFNDAARLDADTLWPTHFAITAWNDANAARLRATLETAVG